MQPCALEAVQGRAYGLAPGGASSSNGLHVDKEEEDARDEADAVHGMIDQCVRESQARLARVRWPFKHQRRTSNDGHCILSSP